MKRLISSGLMFGNLIHIDSPVLVERYNRALEHLTGKRTERTDFYVDISGYSPEIGHELDDHLYLNPNGVNRQFILLSVNQKTAPLLNAKFSTSRDILRQFIDANEAQLFALTAKDAVAGELINSVFVVSDPVRLFDIHNVKVEADTTGGAVRDAALLGQKVDRFLTEEDAWYDDVLIGEMIGLAKKTGDVVRNPVQLDEMEFEQRNFWTQHFGGLYLFRDVPAPAVIAHENAQSLGDLPIAQVISADDRNRVAQFLEVNGLVEPIVKARGVDSATILRQKMDFIVVDVAQDVGFDLTHATRRDMRMLARRYGEQLPQAWHGLNQLAQWADGSGPWPHISSDHSAYFYTLRSADHGDRDLVNMLLAELTPMDIRQLFICHKQLFYALYEGWPEAKRAYVVDFLQREYQVDKSGARAALFGHNDAPMAEPTAVSDDLIDRVGPWGAVRR